jgi:hypothetical protein
MSFRRNAFAVIAALATFFTTAVGSATVIEQISLEEMTQRSDAIVHGVVTRTGSRWDMEHDEPVTITEVRVLRWIKGGDAPTVTIRERGGQVQDRGMWVAGTPRYAVNEEVVVFLERHPERPAQYRTYSLVMGKFRVRHGIGTVPPAVVRDLDGVGLVRWDESGEMEIEHGDQETAMHLETFVDYVRRLVDEEVSP